MVTANGLVKYIPDENKFEFILDPANPEGYEMLRILQDSTGTFWIKSTSGIQSYNDTEKKFRHFSSDIGLPIINEGITIFSLVDNKYIMLGSPGVITTFNPYLVGNNTKSAALLFTDISIDGKPTIPLQVSGIEKKIIVHPGEVNIEIHIALLNYTIWQQNKLYYRLSGKDNEWIETKDGDISLYSLPPGEYVLKIKGINRDVLAGESTDQLLIIVKPYWYQSLTFRLFCLLALAAAMYLFIRWRIKSVKVAAALKQQITETEMAALKAQMNPHFMFNCINSIDAFIQSNDKYNATLYLNKFAKLIRNVLDSSKQNLVTFSKDIETLKLYIELEELRSENKFTSILNIDEELMSSDYKVPPLIIQPFVENAIIHGLRNKETNDGILSVNISKTEQQIVYSITDNGIGRTASQKINTGKEKSYGMEMSYERIKLFNKETTASVTITDLYENEKATGTNIQAHLNIV